MYDLIAVGQMDKGLTSNPTHTFWRAKFQRHTRFALESVNQPFNTQVQFGQVAQILVNRVGDMIYYMYLQVSLPGIVACDTKTDPCPGIATGGQFPTFMDGDGACNPCRASDEAALLEYLPADYNDLTADQQADALQEAKNVYKREHYGARRELACCTEGDSDCPSVVCPELGDTWCHWCNNVGHFLINTAKLIIGGQTIDTLWGTFLMIWEELSGKSGRRLTEMVGSRYTRAQLICDSAQDKCLWIPLCFFCTTQSGSALPLASLAYHGVSLEVDFAKLEQLIVVSRSDVAVRNAKTGLGLTANDLRASMELTYVFLEQSEREKFTSAHFEQLICCTQHYHATYSKKNCRIPLSFNHPTMELIFCIRRECQARCNNWGNFSGAFGMDPIESAELFLNTTSRFGSKVASYWRCVVPYQHHSNIPDSFVYVMSFALSPEGNEPCGSINLSRIDSIELSLTMQTALANENFEVLIFARSWNLLRFREGIAGKAYA